MSIRQRDVHKELEKEVRRSYEHAAGGSYVETGYATLLALFSINRSLIRIARAVEKLASGSAPPPSGPTLGLTSHPVAKGLVTMPPIAPLTIDTNTNDALACAPKDAAGNPTTPTLTWSSSDTAVLELTVAADGLSALGVSKIAGTATVTVTDGALTDSQDVTVTAGATVTLGLTGSAVPK